MRLVSLDNTLVYSNFTLDTTFLHQLIPEPAKILVRYEAVVFAYGDGERSQSSYAS